MIMMGGPAGKHVVGDGGCIYMSNFYKALLKQAAPISPSGFPVDLPGALEFTEMGNTAREEESLSSSTSPWLCLKMGDTPILRSHSND